jgi:hypothetical protein
VTFIEIALVLLLVQAALGAFDTFYSHEWVTRLPDRPEAATELALHSVRSAAFLALFGGLAWFEWRGGWGWMLLALIVFEYLVTLTDSVVEDRIRVLPAVERVNHMLLGLNAGLYSALVCIEFATHWRLQPTQLARVHHGALSWALTACAAAVGVWAVRDALAAMRWHRARPVPGRSRPLEAAGNHQPGAANSKRRQESPAYLRGAGQARLDDADEP